MAESLQSIRDNNFRLLHLYSLYINERADFITPEMVQEVAQVGEMNTHEAFLLLLAEACGVHPTDGMEDSRFFSEYLAPSVNCLNPVRYKADPYWQNIRFPEVREEEWELRRDCYQPFQAFIMDDVRPDTELRELPPLAYFPEPFEYPVVLQDGREWMLVTPNEIETVRPAIAASRGKCVTFGLGLGYYAYMASEKSEVTGVTVVERDEAVIRLFERYLLPQFPHREKVRVIHADAFDFLEGQMKQGDYDFAYADIWHDAGDGIQLYLRLNKYEARFPGTVFQYWIEESMLSYLRWYDFERMPAEVREPRIWLNNANTRRRARTLTVEEWETYRNPENI